MHLSVVIVVIVLAGALGVALALGRRRGPISWILKLQEGAERERIEDALKYLYECEYQGGESGWAGLSGMLGIAAKDAARVLTRLLELGLIRTDSRGYHLTPKGQKRALRVIRVHRLLEHYLSEETGVEPERWHAVADRREHLMSDAAVELLAKRMGRPRYDPHGDPIPTADGEITPLRGTPLLSADVGSMLEVVHLEDEPPPLYAELVSRGFAVGTSLRVVEIHDDHVHVSLEGRDQDVPLLLAANIRVTEHREAPRIDKPRMTLADVKKGECALVQGLSPRCRGINRRRILDLGVVPGTPISVQVVSPNGDPSGYLIRGAVIALRREQAREIWVENIRQAA